MQLVGLITAIQRFEMDLEGKHVVYVADCGGIAYETCKVLVTKKIAVSRPWNLKLHNEV